MALTMASSTTSSYPTLTSPGRERRSACRRSSSAVEWDLAKKKTREQLETENRVLRRFRASEGIASVLNNLIRWGAFCFIAWCGYQSVAALAGETTAANIGVAVMGDFRISEALAWLLGASGVGYGVSQRKVRKDTVERLQGRNQQLEQGRDPRRTSSKLTPRGDTRPEDRK